ncbi:hypothetical protein [Pseudomonas sp. URMO17WK12:I11]|uniref:hypothetical protein n=1 Tax=Pseudomonas sp. URMO17WK12:I11 TaxID=1283291 RepID=UPI0011A63429|nr:hypothetical protein [Pseudomonas sp. URMO17WK12:I11]
MNDLERQRLIDAVSDTITNQFMTMVPAQPDAHALRVLLSEMIETVTLATAALMPGFEDDPAYYIRMGRIGAAPSLDGLLRTVMAPGSKAWSPPS